MPTSDEYRKISEKYYRFARDARTETDRLALLDLAETWQQRASPLRRVLRLLRKHGDDNQHT